MSKKRAEMTDDQKIIILGMFKSGMKSGKIAKELSIDRSTTYKFLKRYNESGTIKNKMTASVDNKRQQSSLQAS